jgi:cellulose synthase/poly-beta-1,6-N-acetylglucosamine synthase-like glycosyltransferase
MILIPILIIYTIFIVTLTVIVFYNTKKDQHSAASPDKLPPLSIVIPFRNEANNLSPLLQSLNKQEYMNRFEVVLVNDNSTDNSLEIINSHLPELTIPVTILESAYDLSNQATSKQQAIDLGIKYSQFDYIVLTDADMLYDTDWLQSLGMQASGCADLSFGRTAIVDDKKLFGYFQAFQLDFLFSVAFVFYYAGITGSCMGNNMLISKTQYNNVGGHKKIGYSIVEDRALFSLFKKNKKHCTITEPFDARAYTYPCQSIKQYYHQMLRWAKGGFSAGSNLLPIGLLFSFQNILFITVIFKLLSTTATIITLGNYLLTWFFIAVCFKAVKSKVTPLLFPIFHLVLMIESAVFLISLLLFPKVYWKGRKI